MAHHRPKGSDFRRWVGSMLTGDNTERTKNASLVEIVKAFQILKTLELSVEGKPSKVGGGVKPTLLTTQAPSQAFQQICSVSSPLLQPV